MGRDFGLTLVLETARILEYSKGLQCRFKAKRPPPFRPSFGVDLTRKKEFCNDHITKSLFSRHILAKTSVTLR